MATLHRIVLTGGPCGGKSTALAKIADRLSTLGFQVLLVPEAASLLFQGGASLRDVTAEQRVAFQSNLLRLQRTLEDSFLAQARASGRPAVLLMDRGTMDISAYLDPLQWQSILDEQGFSAASLRDLRYDAVIHLVTAADGAPSYYSTGNHSTRTENDRQAVELDRRIQQAYLGHPHLRVIDNSTDFNGKIQRVFDEVCRVTGAPRPVPIERKYLLRAPLPTLPLPAEIIDIEQTYLRTTDGSEARVRRRIQRGAVTFVHTLRRPLLDGQRVELQRTISPREYAALCAQADPARRTLRKRRTCFVWEQQYFEIDEFLDPITGLALLSVELSSPEQDVTLPPFLTVEREVTSKPEFSGYSLANR
ncbi:MAG: AAA family ATPase [Polyangiaceae bacterium]|jgi:CYTH domain-containing protein/predicted ATPase|nr:AAA family ATPase [Polyangiaceae bacterium]